MILFCDTSALAKLFIQETGSDQVAKLAADSDVIAVSRIAWVEMMSALSRRVREQAVDAAVLELAKQRLAQAWPDYLKLELTQALAERAGDLADAFALRAYDSVQLASAELLHRTVSGPLLFACYDLRLVKAARMLGLDIMG